MFKREIKKQFNENKYNVLTAKGNYLSHQSPHTLTNILDNLLDV